MILNRIIPDRQVVMRYTFGLLYVNFKFVWEGAMEVLRQEAEHRPAVFWALFLDRVELAARLTHTVTLAEGVPIGCI